MNTYTDEQHERLSYIADFDHVFQVDDNGNVTDDDFSLRTPDTLDVDAYATELEGWHLPLSGMTGQDRYSGPWLHDSEVIVGGVAERVLAIPGHWAAIYGTHSCCDDFHPLFVDVPEDAPLPNANHPADHSECDTLLEGWTMVHRPFTATTTS